VLDPAEARALLDSIDTSTVAGLRDRALIGLMVYSFAWIGAALGMAVEDVYTQNRRLWVRLREKGGKRHAMPCHHNLEEYLIAYLDGADPAQRSQGAAVPHDRPRQRQAHPHGAATSERICDDPPARRRCRHRHQARQSQLPRNRVHRYLKNGGTLEKAAALANHASTPMTQLYDRRRDEVSLDKVERILI
jgi:integrase/recombinase XerC